MTKKKTETEAERWTRMMKELIQAKTAADRAQQRVDDAVAMLRAPDTDGHCLASWDAIATALGVTRQAAQQRYHRRGL